MRKIHFRTVQVTRDCDSNRIAVWSEFVDLALYWPQVWKPTKDKEAKPLFTLTIEESLCLFNFAPDWGKREVCKIIVELFDAVERTNFKPLNNPAKLKDKKSWIQKIYAAWRGLF